VPEEVDFATKPQIALEQLREACAAGLRGGVVLMDPGYGHDGQLRAAVTALGLAYVAAIQSNSTVWPSGSEPKHGDRAPTKGRRDEPDLVWVKEVALGLPNKAWRRIKWREGSADWLSSRFARLRVRDGHCHRPTIAHRSGC
jgi:SRSO17 transposase